MRRDSRAFKLQFATAYCNNNTREGTFYCIEPNIYSINTTLIRVSESSFVFKALKQLWPSISGTTVFELSIVRNLKYYHNYQLSEQIPGCFCSLVTHGQSTSFWTSQLIIFPMPAFDFQFSLIQDAVTTVTIKYRRFARLFQLLWLNLH